MDVAERKLYDDVCSAQGGESWAAKQAQKYLAARDRAPERSAGALRSGHRPAPEEVAQSLQVPTDQIERLVLDGGRLKR